jgi:glycosyltransferase involved in cell wall biosynthesis
VSDTRPLLLFATDAETFGGAEGYLRTLLLHADAQRFRLCLMLPPRPATQPLVDAANARGATVVPFEGGHREGFDPFLIARAARVLRRLRPAIVHFVLPAPRRCAEVVIGAFLARVPARLATFQLVTPVPVFGAPIGAARALNRALQFRTLTHGIAVSRGNRRLLVEQYAFPPARLALIPNGVDTERFTARPPDPAVRERWGVPAAMPLVGIVGRLSRQKGHRALFDAMPGVWRQHPNTHLAVVGVGELEAELRAYAAALDPHERIRFVGQQHDVPAALAALDVVALPSLYEGMPFALLEAMAIERAVLATAVDGTAELVHHGQSGLLVQPGDDAALAQGLVRLLGDEALRERLGRAARARVLAHYSQAGMLARTFALYDGAP